MHERLTDAAAQQSTTVENIVHRALTRELSRSNDAALSPSEGAQHNQNADLKATSTPPLADPTALPDSSNGIAATFFPLPKPVIRIWIVAIVVLALLPWWWYRHLHIAMFLGESGYLQNVAASNAQVLRVIEHDWFRYNYNGHYIPLAFNAELLTTKLFGTNETLWKLRQLGLVSLLGVAVFTLFFFVSSLKLTDFRICFCVAGVPTLILLSMPLMSDLVHWPFMSLQLVSITMSIIGVLFLVTLTGRRETPSRWLPWACVVTSYAALHCSGIGLSAAGAMIVCLATLWYLLHDRPEPYGGVARSLEKPLLTLTALTVVHALVMVYGTKPSELARGAANVPAGIGELFIQSGAFIAAVIHVLGMQLWGPQGFPIPRQDFLSYDAAYGWGFIILAVLTGAGLFLWCERRPGPWRLTVCSLYVFGMADILLLSSIVVVRLRTDPTPLANYLIGSRYIVPFCVAAIILLFLAILAIPVSSRLLVFAGAGGLILATQVGQYTYDRNVAPLVWPAERLSHAASWGLAKELVLECRRNRLAIPDVSVKRLTDFDWTLRVLEPALRSELNIPQEETLSWVRVTDLAPVRLAQYYRLVPSLGRLNRSLEPETAGALFSPGTVPLIGWPAITVQDAKVTPRLDATVSIGDAVKKSIWLNAPGTVVLQQVPLGADPILLVSIGIHSQVWTDPGGDGAVFEIDVSDGTKSTTVLNRFLNPSHVPSDRRWVDVTADLSQFRNETVNITLKSLPGPAGNDYADWCIWGDARIVERSGGR
ncbi:MAG: hypothetical protein C5B51_24785 [Terriglobia bacterium]|nr:MAG: hypothetical protein C5B51_24785 [Terriglobia bacterium]